MLVNKKIAYSCSSFMLVHSALTNVNKLDFNNVLVNVEIKIRSL